MVLEYTKPYGIVGVAQWIADFPPGSEVEFLLEPIEEWAAFICEYLWLQGTDVDWFEITLDHPDIRKFTITINEGLLSDVLDLGRMIVITTSKRLRIKVKNTDTAEYHRFECVAKALIRRTEEAERIIEESIEQIQKILLPLKRTV